MPATSSVDDARGDWSRGYSMGDTEGPVEGQARPRGHRRGRKNEPPEEHGHAGSPAGDEPTEQVPTTGGGESDLPGRPEARAVLTVVAFTGLLTVALLLGAIIPPVPYAVVILVVQVLYTLAWTVASAPPAPRIVAAVGLIAAVVVDVAAVSVGEPSLAPLAYVTAATFVVGVVGQLARPAGRARVTESLASTLAVVIGVTAVSSLVVLTRHDGGNRSIVACLVAAGVAVVVARLTDLAVPHPRVAPQVPRGGVGVLLGLLLGAAAAAAAAAGSVAGAPTGAATAAGLATAIVAVVVDLSVDYAHAGRQLDGAPPPRRPAWLLQGPLVAFALAAPVAYAASALLLLERG